MFISLEGVDGVGKSTQARLLASELRVHGRDVIACREPGGTRLGEEIRNLLLGADSTAVAAATEALLFAAARAQLVREVIEPGLARGAWVVCDRFLDSSVAYQGRGRRLGVRRVRSLSLFATGGLLPDRTIVLDGPRRVAGADRIEMADAAFQRRVAAGFVELAQREPSRVVIVDAAGSVDDVARRVWRAIDA